MSLVNEALKRAEQDKRRHLAGMQSPLPQAAPPETPRRRRGLLVTFAALLVAGGAGFGAYALLGEPAGGPTHATAASQDGAEEQTAAVRQAQRARDDRRRRVERRALQAAAEAPPPPAPKAPAPLSLPEPDWSELPDIPADAWSGTSEDAGHEYPRDDATGARDGRDAERQATPRAEPSPPRESQVADGDQGGAVPPPAEPADAPPVQAPPGDDEAPDISEFTVNAILVGPDGPTAMVNGRMVRAGQTIHGARVVKITRDGVELEIAGRRHHLGL